jgi:hypothetical protein
MKGAMDAALLTGQHRIGIEFSEAIDLEALDFYSPTN